MDITPQPITPQQVALWLNKVERECLLECEGDVQAALEAAEYIVSTQPFPDDIDLSIDSSTYFGMVGDEWHGPTPPGKGWAPIADGPRGGRRWKKTKTKSGVNSGRGTESRGTGSRGDTGADNSRGGEGPVGGPTGTKNTERVPGPVQQSLKPRIVTARASQTPKPDISKVPKELQKFLVSPDGATHQLEGAAMAISAVDRVGGFLLADGAGAGKTRQMLAVAKTYAMRGKKAVIVAPAGIIKPDWDSNTISGSIDKDGLAMDITLKLNNGSKDINKGDVCVTTYESLRNIKDKIDKDTVVIFDEAHGLKNATSARAQYGREVSTKAMGVVYGSATPADSVRDIAYLFRTRLFGAEPWSEVKDKFSVKKLGASGVLSNVSDVFDKLTKEGIMVKREISLDGVQTNFEHIILPQEVQAALEDMKNDKTLGRAQLLMNQRFAQERYKIPHAVDTIKKELAEGRQVVVFVAGVGAEEGEIGTAGMLREALSKSGVIPHDEVAELHGAEGGGGRESVAAFQDGSARVLITTAQSGGTGHNLDDTIGDRPRTQIIMTPPFSAIDNSQIWGRTHRLTTKSASRMHYIFADTKVDRWNANLIRNKMATLNAIVGGETARQAIPEQQLQQALSLDSTIDQTAVDIILGLIDGKWHGLTPPSYGTWVLSAPGPRGGTIWERADGRSGDRRGRRGDGPASYATSRRVEGATRGPGTQGTGRTRTGTGKSTGAGTDKTKEARAIVERMNRRFSAYKSYFRKFKDWKEAEDWVDSLQKHVSDVGVDVALSELRDDSNLTDKVKRVQYKGVDKFKAPLSNPDKADLNFIKKYLNHVGITFLPREAKRDKSVPLIASAPITSAIETYQEGDIVTAETTWDSKLVEAKLLPGLESTEDIHKVVGRRVDQITPSVMKKLDSVYGKDNWVIKNYGEEALAGFGVFFPQRCRQIQQEAKQTLSECKRHLEKLGYQLYDDNGNIQEPDSASKEVRRLYDVAITASINERGAKLPNTSEDRLLQEYGIRLIVNKNWEVTGLIQKDGTRVHRGSAKWHELEEWDSGPGQHSISRAITAMSWYGPSSGYDSGLKYMVQPAFKSPLISESDRKEGVTWETGHEARVHAVTNNGKVSIVPYATLASRHDTFPAVFHTREIADIEKTVEKTLKSLPRTERVGQTYGVDVMKTTDGWRVVETNASVAGGQSMWLRRNPFVIDAFVSHLTNREPAHVKFVRDVLTNREPPQTTNTGGISASIDAHGREHAPAGSGKGGQFVSGPSITHSKARVRLVGGWFRLDTNKRVRAALNKFIGRDKKGKTLQDFATLVAAPDDSTVTIKISKHGDEVEITIKHKKFEARRSIRQGEDEDGTKYTWIYNKELFIKPEFQSEGLGTDLFYKQVTNASSMGVRSIYAVAGHGKAADKSKMNGYYTLPRLGYDARIDDEHIYPDKHVAKIKEAFPKARTIRDIMKTEEGRKWWKENGTWIIDAEFDLTPGSTSMLDLTKYINHRKKLQIGG